MKKACVWHRWSLDRYLIFYLSKMTIPVRFQALKFLIDPDQFSSFESRTMSAIFNNEVSCQQQRNHAVQKVEFHGRHVSDVQHPSSVLQSTIVTISITFAIKET